MELAAHASYSEFSYEIRFWRTKTGLEVDFVLGEGEAAVEVKGSSRVDDRELRPLQAFIEEYKPMKAIVVCTEKEPRKVGAIYIMPWRSFLQELWADRVVRLGRYHGFLPLHSQLNAVHCFRNVIAD